MPRYECFVVNDSDVTPVSCDDINGYDFSRYFIQTCMIFILIILFVLIRPTVLYCVHKWYCLKNEIPQEIETRFQEKEIQCDIDIIHQIIIHPDQSLNLTEVSYNAL